MALTGKLRFVFVTLEVNEYFSCKIWFVFCGLAGHLRTAILVDFAPVGYANMGTYDTLFKDWEPQQPQPFSRHIPTVVFVPILCIP